MLTPKYTTIHGYNHPIWEMVDSIIDYLFRYGKHFNEHIIPIRNYLPEIVMDTSQDNINNNNNIEQKEILDKWIHYQCVSSFIARYKHKFLDLKCPSPISHITDINSIPNELINKYSHLPINFFSLLFNVIHLNAYINQTLMRRHICGHGLYSISSFYDHSCLPNIAYVTFNGKLQMVTTRIIEKGEKLVTSYLAEFIDECDLNERRARLQWMGFNCHCPRCIKEVRME